VDRSPLKGDWGTDRRSGFCMYAVKVLDFGLAKLAPGPVASPDLSQFPTITASVTGECVVLGTVPYMAPEQVRGLGVDKHVDNWGTREDGEPCVRTQGQ
jgi:serine/threonine protein kinase